MGSKLSKRHSSYKSEPKAFKIFLNFLPNSPHKTVFGIFEILKIEILTNLFIFINMGPNGSENFKTLLHVQIAARRETCREFSSQWSSQKYIWGFWSFEFLIFNYFFDNSKFTTVAYGEVKNLSYLENERS